MKNLVTGLFCLVLSTASIHSQEKCGSKFVGESNLALALKMMAPPNECNFLEKARRDFQISCHISKDSVQNIESTTIAQIQEGLDILNEAFSPIEMSFSICFVDTMENPHRDHWIQDEDESFALIYNYIPETINIYFTDITERNGEVVGGYAYFPGGLDMVVINCDDDGGVNGGVLIHEMGHFFGLFHTFEDENGIELADGSNCGVAGDFICDTEADPEGIVNDDCLYLGPFQDSQGNWYTPPTDNFMSYYDECPCEFTLQQYNRMVEMFLTIRYYLW